MIKKIYNTPIFALLVVSIGINASYCADNDDSWENDLFNRWERINKAKPINDKFREKYEKLRKECKHLSEKAEVGCAESQDDLSNVEDDLFNRETRIHEEPRLGYDTLKQKCDALRNECKKLKKEFELEHVYTDEFDILERELSKTDKLISNAKERRKGNFIIDSEKFGVPNEQKKEIQVRIHSELDHVDRHENLNVIYNASFDRFKRMRKSAFEKRLRRISTSYLRDKRSF